MNVIVAAIESVTPGVKRFTLVPERGLAPTASPGSHVGVELPLGDRVVRNSYSLVSSPYQRACLQIAVKRELHSRGGSAFLHEGVAEGDRLRISPPRNLFPLPHTATKHLLLAGGIGITPFLSYLPALERRGVPFELHFTFRGWTDAPFARELATGLGDRFTGHDSTLGGRLDVTALLARQPAGAHVSVCGPGALIDDVVARAAALGWPRTHVHFERFSAPVAATARPFRVALARSGQELEVAAEHTLLDALERAGVAVPSSCRIGGCGTCVVGVADGEIEHRDHCWTEDDRADGRRLLACVSRARNGHLVLDL